jgi:formylglycine-generating enzyme required for sulfatase activity
MAEPDAERELAADGRRAERQARARGRGRASDMLGGVLGELQTTEPQQVKTLTNGVGMPFVLVPAGTFQMGSPPDEPGYRSNEGPVHEVVLSRPFYLGVRPVTQFEYLSVTGRNPAKFTAGTGGGPDHPVENVSWDDATEFCHQLGERPTEREAGRHYRLPTEAEWEYACRAGTSTAFGHGAGITPGQGNFGEAVGGTTPVGRYPPNSWGLHDTHGTVWEWCGDWYGEAFYRAAPLRDPAGPPAGKYRVLRGGSWRNGVDRCRAAYRNALAPYQRDPATGFRVVLVVPTEQGV